MTKHGSEIEVEVVEVENTIPAEIRQPETIKTQEPEWRQWQGRVRRIDARWWPLWVIPGIILLLLLATVGVVIGVLVAIFLLLRNLVRALMH